MSQGADVVVVGGGIIGCATAYELARRGARVTLLERDELAAGASGRNHGLLLTPLDPLLVPMAASTTELYDEFAPRSSVPVGMDPEPVGFLIVSGPDDAERTAGRLEAEAAAGCGVKVEHVDAREVHELEPALAPDVAEGWLLHNGRRLQPALLSVGLALGAQALGAEVRTHTQARALLADGTRVTGVVTDHGSISADTVVLAAGPWSAPLLRSLGISLPVVGARGWLVGLGAERPPITRLVERAGWHEPPEAIGVRPMRAGDLASGLPEALMGTLLQPNPDGTLLVGGSRQLAYSNEPQDLEVPRRLLREAVRLVPALAEAPVLSAWWGLRPMTPDGRPLVGRLRDGLLVATGHGSIGVILGGGTARLVVSIVMEDPPPFDAAAFDPFRFGGGP